MNRVKGAHYRPGAKLRHRFEMKKKNEKLIMKR